MAVMTPGGRGFVHRNGLRVSPGLRRMVFPPGLEASSDDLVSTYEAKIQPAIEQWQTDPPPLILNVGCAEGYYAVLRLS